MHFSLQRFRDWFPQELQFTRLTGKAHSSPLPQGYMKSRLRKEIWRSREDAGLRICPASDIPNIRGACYQHGCKEHPLPRVPIELLYSSTDKGSTSSAVPWSNTVLCANSTATIFLDQSGIKPTISRSYKLSYKSHSSVAVGHNSCFGQHTAPW